MKKDRHAKDFWKGKGFYLALALVIAGAATASFLAINSMMSRMEQSPQPDPFGEEDIPWQQNTPVDESQEGVPVAPSSSAPAASSKDASSQTASSSSSRRQSTASSSSSSQPAAQSASPESPAPEEPASSQIVQEPLFASPKSGATLQTFSGNELVFNETMKDWRTHNGMDIAGKAGDVVAAPAAATVAAVGEDAQWGGFVELQEGDLIMRLCGLGELSVKEGDAVALGDRVGTLGQLPAESAMTPHLHLEFLKDGEFVNPAEYFAPVE
ncbi:MAG: M23 family metallopeptidase [Subdoligranulum sp.]|nr:M23 family metallopeptidase [Subdoligranulum sp.]MBD5102987.1 M23 family metallopeptidase [Subdoligranulum sp.]